MAAAIAVFNTFELLEMITMNLPVADILVMSRVCKSGRSVLEKSLEIRRILFKCYLPGSDFLVNGVPVNNGSRRSHWIFRTAPLYTPLGDQAGRLLVFTTPATRFIVFFPLELSQNIICNGIHLSVTPHDQQRPFQAGIWTLDCKTSDGRFLGFYMLRDFGVKQNVVLAYVRTFYGKGWSRERSVAVWTGSTRIFAESVAVKMREEMMRKWKPRGKLCNTRW